MQSFNKQRWRFERRKKRQKHEKDSQKTAEVHPVAFFKTKLHDAIY